ncbi:MAG: VanZ family protein, partial [archaeon]|nr:VanZ family protein [archaeon]
MEKNTKKIINIVLLILWLAIIFYFSNQPGNLSSSLSDNLTLLIFNNITDFLIFIVRKIAHISEYFILAILMYNVFKDYLSSKKSYLITFILSILYACSDEIH